MTVPFVGKVNSTFNDAKAYLQQVTSALEACGNGNLLNSITCAANVTSSAKSEAQNLLKDVKTEIEQGKQVLSKVLPDVAAAINTIIQSAEEKAEDIGTEIVQCVQTALKA